jgi:flagellar protein FlaG
MSSDVFLGGISPYTPNEPATKSVESAPQQQAAKPGSNEQAQRLAAEVTKAPRPEAGAQPAKRLSFDELRDMMRQVNLYLDPFEVQTQFIVDKGTGDVVVKIVNTVSGEVIRRIPAAEFMKALDAPGGVRGLFTDRLA